MRPQYNNFLLSSVNLWLDHVLLNKGQAYFNKSSNFYPINNYYGNLYAYAAPYKQMVYDSSVSGAEIMTGVYVNGVYKTTGQSNFVCINYEEGLAIFSQPVTGIISGNYAAKELNIKSINESDEYLLFKNKFYNKNNISVATGNLTNQQPFPVIYIRNDDSENEPYSFGGEDASKNVIKLVILADSQYLLDSTVSLLTDQKLTYFSLFNSTDMPFNTLGGLYNGEFNYTGFFPNKMNTSQAVFIEDVKFTRFNSVSIAELKKINNDIYVGVVDLYTEFLRYPRC